LKSPFVLSREFLSKVSDQPGVYLMQGEDRKILYVGKARNLRKRLSSYAGTGRRQSPKTRLLLSRLAHVETIITNTEKEALLLEASFIKKHKPPFNISLRDDKNYPYIKLTVQEKWPRAMMTRRTGRDGARYFGPYSSAGAMWETLNFLNKTFPLRLCKKNHLTPRKRPCLNYQIGRCLAPCAGMADPAQYTENVKNVLLLLEGRNEQLIKELDEKMQHASDQLLFEKAAIYRDRITALEKTLEKQAVNTGSKKDQDVFAIRREGSLVVVSLLVVRHGVIETRRNFSLTEPVGDDQLILAELLSRYYADDKPLPHEIVVPFTLEEGEMLVAWLSEKAGRKVSIKAASRGILRKLLLMAEKNAAQAIKDSKDKDMAWQVLASTVVKTLGLKKIPQRIECLDISNIGGQQSVGSLVCFEAGRKSSKNYRSFKIRSVAGPDDYASMAEVIRRRFAPEKGRVDYPDLFVVDGGRGQLNIAVKVFSYLGVPDEVELAAIAKGKEEGEVDRLYVPNRKNAIVLKPHSPVLLLFMQIRDEAHRFGITLHRKLRSKKTLTSVLDSIPHLGEKRKKTLLSHFGSAAQISAASVQELARVEGVGTKLADLIFRSLHDAGQKKDGVGP